MNEKMPSPIAVEVQNLAIPEVNSDLFLVGDTSSGRVVYVVLATPRRQRYEIEVVTIDDQGKTRRKVFAYDTKTKALRAFFSIGSRLHPQELMVSSYGQLFPL